MTFNHPQILLYASLHHQQVAHLICLNIERRNIHTHRHCRLDRRTQVKNALPSSQPTNGVDEHSRNSIVLERRDRGVGVGSDTATWGFCFPYCSTAICSSCRDMTISSAFAFVPFVEGSPNSCVWGAAKSSKSKSIS